MKKIHTLTALLFLNFTAFGQIINIPDANFKTLLLTGLIIDSDDDGLIDTDADLNNDGEIDEDEALNIEALYASSQEIADLTGMGYFTNMIRLEVNNNQLVSIDVHNLHNLIYLQCSNNLLTEISLCGTSVRSLWCYSNPSLTYISVKNNIISTLDISRNATTATPPPLTSFMFFDLPLLQNVCYDEGELPAFQGMLEGDVTITTSCSSDCNLESNVITGNIVFDQNANGCDSNDVAPAFVPVRISLGATDLGVAYTNAAGNYTAYAPEGTITVTPGFEHPYYYANPIATVISFTGTGNADSASFCIQANGVHPDLEISLIPITNARPGFDALYKLIYKNKGTQTLSGTVVFAFDDALLDFVSSNPAAGSQSAGSLTWNFADLTPFETRNLTVTLNVNSPLETPPVNNGDLLTFSTTIDPESVTDEAPEDNATQLTQVVTGSFDPNDKAVSALITPIENPEYLHYTIRFQNTGTASAENVSVTDILSEKLDTNTLQVVGASHPLRSNLTEGNQLEFFFDNINLPATINDEPGSHGYVSFKIKPKTGNLAGETVENTAKIYFDFNFPVVTNPVSTIFYSLLQTEKFDTENDFILYPNPVENILHIEAGKRVSVGSAAIYNTLGQLVQSVPKQGLKMMSIDVSQIKSGTYFVEIVSDQRKSVKRFVKL
jgi:uncharacterized repeat protein (TIGR01451 family)